MFLIVTTVTFDGETTLKEAVETVINYIKFEKRSKSEERWGLEEEGRGS